MQQKKNINIFIFPIVALFTFVMLVFGAAYAYLSGIVNMNTANYQVVLPSQTSLVCTKTDCSVTVTPAMMLNTNTGSSAKTSSTCAVNCTCTGTQGAVCDYNVYMVEAGTKYIPSTSLGDNKELTVTVSNPSGCSNPTTNNTAYHNSSVETQVNTVRGKIVSHCALEVPAGGSKSANVTAVFKWYNLNINQDGHISKSYKYQLSTGTEVPDAYQQVEYLQSTGTQFIELPFGFERTDVIDFDMSVDTDQTNDKYMVSPKTWNNNSNRFAMGVHSSRFTCGFGSKSTGSTYLTPTTSTDGLRHQWHYENSTFTITDLGLTYNGTSDTFGGVTANLKLFYGYNANTKGKIYRYTHWKNNVKVIDLIPCYRRIDNVIGLYDMVTGTFYVNNGTGTFTKGPNV